MALIDLNKTNFKEFTHTTKYYAFTDKDGITVSIEPCNMGFDIAIYNKESELLHPKVCTNEEGYAWSTFVFDPPKERSQETIDYAIRIANDLYYRYLTGRLPELVKN